MFAQDVPCKFAIALGFDNNTCEESSDINRPFASVDGQLLVNNKTVRFCKIMLAQAERAY